MAKARPNIVDSSGWLEYLADAPAADQFAPAIENTVNGIVWTQDEDFEDLPDVKFFRKSSRR